MHERVLTVKCGTRFTPVNRYVYFPGTTGGAAFFENNDQMLLGRVDKTRILDIESYQYEHTGYTLTSFGLIRFSISIQH